MKNDFSSQNRDEVSKEETSPLVNELSGSVRNEVRNKAVANAKKIETHSIVPNTSDREKRIVTNAKNNLVKGRGGNSENRSEALQNVSDEEIVELTKSFLIGEWLEALNKEIQIDQASTVYVGNGVDESVFNNCKVVASEQFLYSSRKDHVLAVLYLESVEKTGNNDDPDVEKLLPQEDRKVVVRQMLNYFQSYTQVQREWRSSNKPTNNSADNESRMFEWYISNIRPVKEMGDSAIVYAQKTMEEILKINKHSDEERDPYYYLTLPDSFVFGEEGEIVGAVEVKSYSKEEIGALTEELLKLSERNIAEPTLKATVNMGNKSMVLGMDPDAECRFIELINSIRSPDKQMTGSFKRHLDEISTEYPDKLPIVLRITEDIPQETVTGFTKAAEKLGFDQLVIQKIPFTREDLALISRFYCEENLKRIVSSPNASDRDRRVYKALALPSTWGV